MRYVLELVIYPGFIFATAVGLLTSWFERKVSALVQWRKGPPVLQPLYDLVKLAGKETLVSERANSAGFLLAPFLGFAGAIVASLILWNANLGRSFLGDSIVLLYLLVLPALAVILGGLASGNPIAILGATRELKLVLAYEVPLVLAVIVAILKADSLLLHRLGNTITIGSLSGVLAFFVALLAVQVKLGFAPFDIAEAETELIAGPYIEYSGPPLAVFKLTHAMLLFILPLFLVTLFLGGIDFRGLGWLWGILKYLGVVLAIVLIKNTNPRLRIDQAIRFFWRYGLGLALLALVLAIIGDQVGLRWL
ncbi:MAG: NADH-quinone oxidoreductase subunit H [Candidatus Acetothermia bacterium]|jgi:NADH-quinone oxidoreductase subunit H|nr:NADH-quinone oxidoreductase subunit H [Candidatus Acetothermia bacterium]MDH7504763.1 NADH-quinone oxidoreductase subunit H [Candidatus Acetothermia bacterium]